MKWTKKWPKKEGHYWFYGYRYGRISCGRECKPEYCFVEVFKVSNGLVFKADGQFLYKSEPEEAYFQEAKLPDSPINFPYNKSIQPTAGSGG